MEVFTWVKQTLISLGEETPTSVGKIILSLEDKINIILGSADHIPKRASFAWKKSLGGFIYKTKALVWFTLHQGSYCCTECNNVLPLNNFTMATHKKQGISNVCSMCERSRSLEYRDQNREYHREARREHYQNNKGYYKNYSANRRVVIGKATPSWQDLCSLQEFYSKCPEGYHVDHIIPLNNPRVCGLHTICNLQYLSAADNLKKSNKFLEEDFNMSDTFYERQLRATGSAVGSKTHPAKPKRVTKSDIIAGFPAYVPTNGFDKLTLEDLTKLNEYVLNPSHLMSHTLPEEKVRLKAPWVTCITQLTGLQIDWNKLTIADIKAFYAYLTQGTE